MSKLWGGRFTAHGEKWLDEMNASIPFDQLLINEDIEGSLAHVKMLMVKNIITVEEYDVITHGLISIKELAHQGTLEFSLENEDIHLNIEKKLHEIIGPVAGKLHTARSRNDQVALDLHLYIRKEIHLIIRELKVLQISLIDKAKDHVETIFPGYTHLQRAQPISLAHHFLAYFWMFERDVQRLIDCIREVSLSPLGAGALAGTTFPIDPEFTANELGFVGCYSNSLDAVSNRDYIIQFQSNCAILQMHLSRLAEEIILWSSQEFSYIELDDALSTGSSIMPQKKNPDYAELIRGKSGRVYGNLMGILTVMKGLPLAYNKDLQEDKEGLFDTVKTVKQSIKAMAAMIETMTVNEKILNHIFEKDFSNATEVADYLAAKGVPFREAHEIVGRIVLYCIKNNTYLSLLTQGEWNEFSTLFTEDIYRVIDPMQAITRRNSYGGTSFTQVRKAINQAEKILHIEKPMSI